MSGELGFPPDRRPTAKEALDSIKRLMEHFQESDSQKRSAPRLSHFRKIPDAVQSGYDLLLEGAEAIHGTSTKYTLVGKAAPDEQEKIVVDLLQGCEMLGAATHIFLEDSYGCSRSLRKAAVRATLPILRNVMLLMEAFVDGSALDGNVGAQKTGAVWQSCDYIINKMMPKGNRNCIRREIFAWTKDCQDTLDEFQEMVDLGALAGSDHVNDEEEDDFGDQSEQYNEEQIRIAEKSLPILKCSKGTMNVTIQACEVIGSRGDENDSASDFENLSLLVSMGRLVGEGATDLGTCMYPPLDLFALRKQLVAQSDAILALHRHVLSLDMPRELATLSDKIRTAAESRTSDVLQVIDEKINA